MAQDFDLAEFARVAGRIDVPAAHIFLLVETSTQHIANMQFKAVGKRFNCAISQKLLIVARSLPNT